MHFCVIACCRIVSKCDILWHDETHSNWLQVRVVSVWSNMVIFHVRDNHPQSACLVASHTMVVVGGGVLTHHKFTLHINLNGIFAILQAGSHLVFVNIFVAWLAMVFLIVFYLNALCTNLHSWLWQNGYFKQTLQIP